MSMQIYSAIEFTAVFCAYFAVIMALPSLMFARRLRGKGLCERFMFCMVAGNFYIISVVTLIGLAGITSRFVMITLLVGGALWRYFVTTDKDYRAMLARQRKMIALMFRRQLGVRYFLYIETQSVKNFFKKIFTAVGKHIKAHFLEWIIFGFVTLFNIWYFSYQTLHYYGYGASDTIVHLNWVELLASGRMFAAGVYPHGFHCVIYMLYQFFRFELFAIMRYFGAVQSTFIVMMIYVYAKSLCKNKYAPYIAYIAFSFCQIFHTETMMRFQMTVPQEYAMLFLFPMLIYLARFIKQAELEPARAKKPHLKFRARQCRRLKYLLAKIKTVFTPTGGVFFDRQSTFYVTMAAICFSLTLSVHFYITICAGMMCAAFACAYITKIFRKKMFTRLVCAVLAGLFVAMAPMAFAVATGKPLEGSLRWALSIITIGSSATGDIAVQEADEKKDAETSAGETAAATTAAVTTDDGIDELEVETEALITEAEGESRTNTKRGIMGTLAECYKRFVPAVMVDIWFFITLICLIVVLITATLRAIFKKSLRSLAWITMGLYIIFMFFLFNASTIGIPELMDKIRARVLVAYAIPVLFSCIFDMGCGFLGILLSWTKYKEKIVNAVAFILCVLIILGVYATKNVKRPSYFYYLQHNGAVSCLYDIVQQYPTNKWTIVSVVDETRMVWGHGYHYEIIDFLFSQENWNSSKTMYLPTQYVFFYIEKNAMLYSSVQKANNPITVKLYPVSEKYAATKFPSPEYSSKSRYYQKVDRAIVMSKMYYWAQEYMRLYPDDFEVYYEDENFVCYKIEQNVYHLNNFAINYGYNVKK